MESASEGTNERPSAQGDVGVRHLDSGLGIWTSSAPSSPGGFAVGLHVAVGSLCEAEEERGLSHLLEHVAFHGGRNFPPGALERFFDLHGTRLGRHHNANTGLEKTCFSLSFPKYAPETLDRAVACLADFAYGMDLDAGVVERERSVVLEEMRGHEGTHSRVQDRLLGLVLPGSRFAARHPLGAREVIQTVTANELGAYYKRWYRPDTCTITAAGRFVEDGLAETIERHFGGWHAEGSPPPAPDPGVASTVGGACDVITDSDTVEASARLIRALCQEPPRNHEQRIEHSLQDTAIRLLGRRLSELAFDDFGPVRRVRITRSHLACSWHLLGLVATTATRGAVEAAAALVRVLRLISDHGFGDSEVESISELLRNNARRLLRPEKHRPALALLHGLLDAVSSNELPQSAEQHSRILADVSERLDAATLRDAVVSILEPSEVSAAVVLPSTAAAIPSTEQLGAAMRLAASESTSAPVHPPRLRRLLDRPPPPGTAKDRVVDDELGVHSLTLENGVLVHLRPMEEETDLAVVQLTLAGGRIRETVDEVGLTASAAVAFSNPALSGVPSSVIRARLAETTVSLSCSVDEDSVVLRVSSDPEELEHSFQLLHLLLSRPRVEDGVLRRWQAGFEGYAAGRPLGLETQLAQTSLRLLSGDDHRFRLLTHERAEAITAEAAQHWLDHELNGAPLEAAVVGAIDPDRAAEHALSYLGALPARPEHDPRLATLRTLGAPKGPAVEIVETAAPSSKAALMVGWRAAPWHDAELRQPLHMATHILAQRIHHDIRQGSGLSYDVHCSYSPSRAYPAASLVAVTFYTHPHRIDEATESVQVLAERFSGAGPEEREMESVRLLFAELADRAQREPRFWARVLSELRYRDGNLSDLKGLPDRCLRRTSEQIHRAAADSIRPDHRLTVVCRPQDVTR